LHGPIGAGTQGEGTALNLDLIAKPLLQTMEANCRRVTPWSEIVGKLQNANGGSHRILLLL
jgi:hypothetical protein